jgi:hypothetical protein
MFPRYFSGEITNWPRLPCYSLILSLYSHCLGRNREPNRVFQAPSQESLEAVGAVSQRTPMGYGARGLKAGWHYSLCPPPTPAVILASPQPAERKIPPITDQPLPTRNATIRFEVAYDGEGFGKGTIYLNGQEAAEGRTGHTHTTSPRSTMRRTSA